MDLDAYCAAHAEQWRRLAALTAQRRLSGAEADELLDGYQRVATHLSVVRSSAPDPALVGHLSMLLARARSRATPSPPTSWSGVRAFLIEVFPAALYRMRWWWVTTAAVNVALALALGAWFLANPGYEQSLLDPQEISDLVNRDFERYYSEFASSSFAVGVWTNNAWVAALCIAFGVLGVPVIWVLWQNIVNLALVGAVMIRADRGALFFGLLLPHGLLELTAVFVAAGVGLRLFWAWVEPGSQTRAGAFAHEGRSAIGVALGLVVVLLVSGAIEGFVTPSGLPAWTRIGIGVAAEVAFLAYVVVLGGAAHRRGVTGDVCAEQSAAVAPSRG